MNKQKGKRRRKIRPRDYNRYINSKRWHTRRKAYLSRQISKCHLCGSASDLQVHHCTYERLGNELDEDLALLCAQCHAYIHKLQRETGRSVKRITLQVFSPWEGM